jgi:CubicO group peptidase (beta-lactamase class C family)
MVKRQQVIMAAILVLSPRVELSVAAEIKAPIAGPRSEVQTADPRDLAFIEALSTIIPPLLRVHNVPGLNIALARRGRMVWESAYGYADAKLRRPMTPDTVFHSGSLAKAYAATAIMQLVEQGRLNIDDPINRYLPFQVRNPLGGPPITIRHLLTHTSGLGSTNTDPVSYLCSDSRTVRPLVEVLQKIYVQPPGNVRNRGLIWTRPTDARWQYSNIGGATLGLIVERVNAEHLSYSDYVQKKIMDPLGMRYAQIPLAQIRQMTRPDIWERMSVGYQTMGGAWIPTAQVCFGSFPCGGSFATPADYLRLMVAMMHGGSFNGIRILKEESVAAMLTPALEGTIAEFEDYGSTGLQERVEMPRERQGLIWWLRDWDTQNRSFHHEGGHMYGWKTMAMAFPRSDTAFVVAVNHWSSVEGYYNRPEFDSLTAFIEAWLKAELTGTTQGLVATWLAQERSREPEKLPRIQNINWKTSYLRGLLFAESYQFALETPQRLTERQAREFARNTETTLSASQPALWDSEAFVTGVKDMTTVAATAAAIHDFANSKSMRISLDEAKQLYPLLNSNAGSDATLAGLLAVHPATVH